MQPRILVTGGAGFIGAVLVPELVKAGLEVTVFDTFYFGKHPLNSVSGKVKLITGDIREFPDGTLKNVDVVIHLAALSNDPLANFNPAANWKINTEATINLAQKAKQGGVKQFIFASSCSIYDLGLENAQGMRTEKSTVAPTAAYSQSKLAAEQAILPLSDKNFCVTVLRKGTVYGYSPRMRFDLVVNTMIKTALAEGKIYLFCAGRQWRPLISVQDVATVYLKLLMISKEKISGQVFNIAQENYLIKDVAHIVKNTLSQRLTHEITLIVDEGNHKDRSYRVSVKKAQEVLKFKPKKEMSVSVGSMFNIIQKLQLTDYENPRYYNIEWMERFLTQPTQK